MPKPRVINFDKPPEGCVMEPIPNLYTPTVGYAIPGIMLKRMEKSMIGMINECRDQRAQYMGGYQTNVALLLMDGKTKYGNFARTLEDHVFRPEGWDPPVDSEEDEGRSHFLLSIDTGEGVVGHVKRLVIPKTFPHDPGKITSTGMEVVDERILARRNSGQYATLEQLADDIGIPDWSRCINIASNFNTMRGKRSLSPQSYAGTFALTRTFGVDHVFAYMNRSALGSLGRLGVDIHQIMGGRFNPPTPDGGYDESYTAVCVSATDQNLEAFEIARRSPLIRAPLHLLVDPN